MIYSVDQSYAPHFAYISKELLVRRDTKSESVFIEYDLTLGDYRQRIQGNDMSFLAVSDRKPVGFALAYDNGFLQYLCNSNEKAGKDEVMQEALRRGKPFIYIDQIGVLPKHQSRGIGTELYDTIELCARTSNRRLFSAISHEPWRNLRSIDFFGGKGLKFAGEIRTASGLVFGLYTKLFRTF